MTPVQEASLELKAGFVCEALDLAQVHLVWSSNHLAAGRYDNALDAFGKMVAAVRAATGEMVAVRNIVEGDRLTGEAAAEYRAARKSAA